MGEGKYVSEQDAIQYKTELARFRSGKKKYSITGGIMMGLAGLFLLIGIIVGSSVNVMGFYLITPAVLFLIMGIVFLACGSAIYGRRIQNRIDALNRYNAQTKKEIAEGTKPSEAPIPVAEAPEEEESLVDQLNRYKKLLDDGVISEEDYNAIKAKLISKI